MRYNPELLPTMTNNDPLARCALFVAFEGMGLLDPTGPLTVFRSASKVQQLPRDEVAVSAGKEDGYAAQICRLHVSFDVVELPFPSSPPCQTSLGLVSSNAPGAPSSRPIPEAFTPPKGARGSEWTMSLMNTIPASMRLARRLARSESRLQTAAPSPKSVPLASSTASASVLNA